jgi:hypothetical protein
MSETELKNLEELVTYHVGRLGLYETGMVFHSQHSHCGTFAINSIFSQGGTWDQRRSFAYISHDFFDPEFRTGDPLTVRRESYPDVYKSYRLCADSPANYGILSQYLDVGISFLSDRLFLNEDIGFRTFFAFSEWAKDNHDFWMGSRPSSPESSVYSAFNSPSFVMMRIKQEIESARKYLSRGPNTLQIKILNGQVETIGENILYISALDLEQLTDEDVLNLIYEKCPKFKTIVEVAERKAKKFQKKFLQIKLEKKPYT